MRIKKATNRDLPPRMLRRVRNLKSGAQWVGYYYDGRDENGKRVEIPLGTDLDVAKMEWARLDRKATPKIARLLVDVFNRYEREVIPGKMPRTQRTIYCLSNNCGLLLVKRLLMPSRLRSSLNSVISAPVKYGQIEKYPFFRISTIWLENGGLPT